MEEQNESQEKDSVETEPPPPEKKPVFHIHNTTRGRHNRTLRAMQPVHESVKQYLDGGKYRSIRGRPVVLHWDEFMRLLPEIKQKSAAGLFAVKTQDGRHVNLETLEVAPSLASPPPPNPPLDSIANDTQNVGQIMPTLPGGDNPAGGGSMPDLVSKAPSDPEANLEETLGVTDVEPPPTVFTEPMAHHSEPKRGSDSGKKGRNK